MLRPSRLPPPRLYATLPVEEPATNPAVLQLYDAWLEGSREAAKQQRAQRAPTARGWLQRGVARAQRPQRAAAGVARRATRGATPCRRAG